MMIALKPIVIVLAAGLPFAVQSAEPVESPGTRIERVKKQGSFEELLREMWGRLRSVAPKVSEDAGSRKTQVAGVRGAESTGTLLKPYWKGDRTNDKQYLAELSAYNRAQALADSGDFNGAARAFTDFIKHYPQSSLLANARFGLGLAYGGSGAKQKSIDTLTQFVKTYPKHPLGADAGRMIAALKAG